MNGRRWGRASGAAALAAISLVSGVAFAQDPPPPATPATAAPTSADKPPSAPDPIDAPAERRSGAVFGFELGAGAIDVSGYPNSATHVDDPRFHESSGPSFGYGSRFFLMGALADTLNFGVWVGGMSGQTSSLKMSAMGGGLRIEAFPFYSLVPQLRDLGIIALLGVGGASADRKDKSLSVDGTQSFLGTGVLYELSRTRFIGLKLVPAVTAQYQFITSQSVDSHGVLLGARLAFYGGP